MENDPISNGNPAVNVLSADQAETILDVLQQNNNRDAYFAALVSYLTGMRLPEILALSWDDISFEQARLMVYETKACSQRTVPLRTRALAAFAGRGQAQGNFGKVFADTQRLGNGRAITKAFNWACQFAGLPPRGFRALRDAFLAKRSLD